MQLHKIQLTNNWAVREFKICLQKSKVLPALTNEFIDTLTSNVINMDIRKEVHERPLDHARNGFPSPCMKRPSFIPLTGVPRTMRDFQMKEA